MDWKRGRCFEFAGDISESLLNMAADFDEVEEDAETLATPNAPAICPVVNAGITSPVSSVSQPSSTISTQKCT